MMSRLRLTAFRVSLLVTLGLIGLYQMTVQSNLLRNLETKLLDLRLQLRGVQRPDVPVALVVIDDQSIAELGRWPWSRSHFATVVRRLPAAGARVITLDLLLSEPEGHPVRDDLQALRTTFESLHLPNQSAPLQEFQQRLVALAESTDPDSALATALQEGRHTLLAFSFTVETPTQHSGLATTAPPPFMSAAAYRALRRAGPEPPHLLLTAGELLVPIALLAQAAQALGHVKLAFDTDGTPRYEYPIVPHQDAYYPSLAVQAVRLYLGLALDLGAMVVLGLVIGWLGSILPWSWGTVVTLLLAAGYVVLNGLALTRLGLWVNLLFPLLTVASTYGAVTLYKFLTEARQRRALRRAFQYYLHPALVEQVSQHPELLALGGEKRELTVLFSDIRGFSTFSEGLTPEVLVQLLNEYFNAMTQAVVADDGTVDKYIGDAIMAIYGAPLPQPDHAYHACHSALRMLDALQVLQPHWQERGLPVIQIGIGINSGSMVVGNVGSDLRFAYTAMGDEVNLGSRLEGVNKEYGTQIIISEATWEYVKARLATRELDVIRVKGKVHPTRIFEVLGEWPFTPSQATLVQRFAEGLQAYRSRRWKEAIQLFQETLRDAPDDYPSQLYIQRCQELQTTPPPADWDGVYVMQTK